MAPPPPPLVATISFVRTTSLPPELADSFERLWARWAWLVPTWVHRVIVRYTAESTPAVARVHPNLEYRWAEFEILPRFIDADETERDRTLIHEILHLNLAPMQRWGETQIQHAEERGDRALAALIRETFRQAVEETVTDLTRAVHAQLHPNGPTPD
jgi:hypothetical protein